MSPFNPASLLKPPCTKLVISKLLGYAIVLGSAGVKMPQVYNIVRAGGVEGLSGPSVLIEWFASIASFSYFMALGYPFSTWGENFFLFFQNGIIAALYLRFQARSGSGQFWPTALASAIFGAVLYLRALPDVILPLELCERLGAKRCHVTCTDIAGSMPVLLMMFGRLPQIIRNQQQGHTGTLSLVTHVLNVIGSSARIFTVLQELDDKLVLTSASSAFLQNSVLVAQILLLRRRGAEPIVPTKSKSKSKMKKGA